MSDTKFENLSREVVGVILHNLDIAERQKLRRVSKFCNQNVVSVWGVNLTVHNMNLDSSLQCESDSIQVYFQSLTRQFPIDTDSGIHFLNQLTSLTFTGSIVCYNIVPLFEHCVHLRKLELIRCSLNHKMTEYPVNTEDTYKLLPKLRDLSIKFRSRPFQVAEYNFFKSLLPFFTLNTDTGNEKGKLHSILLDCPVKGGPFRVSFNEIFQKNSFRAIQHMPLGRETHGVNGSEIADEFYTALIEANLKSLRVLKLFDASYGCGIKMKFWNNSPEIKMREFEQIEYPDMNKYKYQWAESSVALFNLLTHQNCLTKLSIALSKNLTLDQMFSIADANARTLGSLSIGLFILRGEVRIERFDMSNFSKLTVLKNLKIFEFVTYEPRGQLVITYDTRTPMYNIKRLPTSLRVFSSSAVLAFDNEHEFNELAFGHLTHLHTFELTATPYFQFGMNKVYKMDSEKIHQLITWLPSLKKLVLRNNRPFEIAHNLAQENIYAPLVAVDTLPDQLTNWIQNTSALSFQKIPIVFFTPMNEIPALLGQYEEFEDVYFREESLVNGFPTIFDLVISVKPNYREISVLLNKLIKLLG